MTKMTSGQRKEAKNVIPFAKEFNNISPLDIENILEHLRDCDYLNDRGNDFSTAFWNLFIKK